MRDLRLLRDWGLLVAAGLLLIGGVPLGVSAHSAPQSPIEATRSTTAPGVTNFSAEAVFPTAAYLNWTATTGECFETWSISYQPPGDTTDWIALASFSVVDQRSWVVTQLEPNSTYGWQLTMISCTGETDLGATTTHQPSNGTLSVAEIGATYYGVTYSFAWTAAPTFSPLTFTSYQIWISQSLGAYYLANTLTRANLTTVDFTAAPYTGYSVYVLATANCACGRSATWFSGAIEFGSPYGNFSIATLPSTSAELAPNVPLLLTCFSNGFPYPMFYNWTFGDGSTGSGGVVSHAWTKAGSFSAECTEDLVLGGIEYTHSRVIDVTVADFTITVGTPSYAAAPGRTIDFSWSSGWAANPPLNITWSCFPAVTLTVSGGQAAITFPTVATYQVSAQGIDGLDDVAFGLATVQVAPVEVSIAANRTASMVGTSVAFTAHASGGSGTGYLYTWTFGDGGTSFGASVVHGYAVAGTYSVSATATDSLGEAAASNETNVTVVAALSVRIVLTPTSPDSGATANLSASISGGSGGYSCAWSLGDGVNASSCNVTHAWNPGGNYTVSVSVTDSLGDHAHASTIVDVTLPTRNSGPHGLSTASADGPLLAGAALVGVATIAIVAFLLWRRRKPS